MACNFSLYTRKYGPPLTPEQEQSPFARFYHEPIEDPVPAVLAAVGEEQMDPALALPFAEVEKVFLPRTEPIRNGWCMLPDGTGFSSITTMLPGATPEMETWWWKSFVMNPADDWLGYKVWFPGLHVSHGRPLTEDLGWGVVGIHMVQPFTPETLGLSAPPEALDPNYVLALGSSGYNQRIDDENDPPYYIALLNVFKRTTGGLRVQSVTWSGMGWQDGTLKKMHDADPEKVRMFAMHNAYEYHRHGMLLPRVYAARAL